MPSLAIRDYLSWRNVFGVLLAASIIVFGVNLTLFQVRPSSVFGLVYGWSAVVMLLILAAFGARRRFLGLASRLRLGSAASWLRLHLYGGLLFSLLVLMHSGFRVPIGRLTLSVWLLSFWVVLSGLVGLLLQRSIPRALSSGLSIEVLWERIPELVEQVRERAAVAAGKSDETLSFFYHHELEPAFSAPKARWIYYIDITGGIRSRLRDFDYLRRAVTAEQRLVLDELEDCYRSKLEIDAHYTLQAALRYWLWAHTPLSLALLALVGAHVVVALTY